MVEFAAITSNGNRINGSVQDARAYSKFDRSASEVPDAPDFSFADLIDTINPLQHIPVLSSIYRGITSDTIHPAARVAGDILYGGVLGVASAAAGAASGISDSVMESDTGKTIPGTMLAALLGEQEVKAQPTTPAPISQVAATVPPASTPQITPTDVAEAATTVPAAPVATIAKPTTDLPAEASPENLDHVLAQLAKTQNIPVASPAPAPSQTALNVAKAYELLPKQKMYPLDRSHQAFGGVIEPRSHPGNVAINNNFLPLKKIPDASESTEAHPNPLPQQLIDDLRALQATEGLGKTSASATPPALDADLNN